MHARLKDMVAEEPGELAMGPVTRRVDLELGGAYQKKKKKTSNAAANSANNTATPTKNSPHSVTLAPPSGASKMDRN